MQRKIELHCSLFSPLEIGGCCQCNVPLASFSLRYLQSIPVTMDSSRSLVSAIFLFENRFLHFDGIYSVTSFSLTRLAERKTRFIYHRPKRPSEKKKTLRFSDALLACMSQRLLRCSGKREETKSD